MIDFSRIEQYRENNRIEAKKALGGLPQSIWETYSAFANTLGGIILLGVEEHRDHSLHTVDLPDPERLVREFWANINDPRRASINILSDRNVQIETVDGDHIIVITVPRAQRYDKPVYIGGDPLSGSYRRSGEGDYRCTCEEVQSMLRDAVVETQDMKVLEHMGLDALDCGSVRCYRLRMKQARPGHLWEELEEAEFLCSVGAAGRGADGCVHPTAAGLLMFGVEPEIVREFPHYSLDYQERMDGGIRQTGRIVSSSGEWSGNLYDFYFRVCGRIARGIQLPVEPERGGPAGDTPVHNALREALANCLINADYYGREGPVILKRKDLITFSNPGAFRIEVEAAKTGGVSDPRNAALNRMFNLINIGEGAGSGIPNIYSVWRKQGWRLPAIEESFEPDRTVLSLPLQKDASCGQSGAAEDGTRRAGTKTAIQKTMIIEYLTDHVSARCSEIAALLGVKAARARNVLGALAAEDIVVAEGSGRARVYKLKS